MPDEPEEPTDAEDADSTEPAEFEHHGLIVTAAPGWDEIELEGYENEEDPPLLLGKDDGVGIVQFSVQTRDQESRIPAGALRNWLLEMVNRAGMGRGFDLVELKSRDAFILGCSFRPEEEVFQRLWYWTDRRRLVLVSYSSEGDPDPDELRECAAMVARLRMSRPRRG